MDNINDDEIIKTLLQRLKSLQEEDRIESERAKNRKAAIEKTKRALDAFSDASDFEKMKEEIEKGIFDFNAYKTWSSKIINLFKYKNRAMAPSQIFEEFRKYIPANEYTDQQVKSIISTELNKRVKGRELKPWKPSNKKMKGYYYANPAWFNKEDDLLEEYKPEISTSTLWDESI